MQLNENIILCRKHKGYSQEYMGMQLRMTQSNYSRLEKSSFIDNKTLDRIADIFETTPDALRSYHMPPKPELTIIDYHDKLLHQKDETIRILTEQVQYLRDENMDLRVRLGEYLRGSK